jgi:hypothetical protein
MFGAQENKFEAFTAFFQFLRPFLHRAGRWFETAEMRETR